MTFAHWDFDAGSTIHAHSHQQEEVWHIIEGKLEVTIGTKKNVVCPGMTTIVPANTRHRVKAITKGKAIVVDYPLRDLLLHRETQASPSLAELRLALYLAPSRTGGRVVEGARLESV